MPAAVKFYAFQFGVYAIKAAENVAVKFTDMKASNGGTAGRNAACINTDGVGYDAKPFTKTVSVPKGKVQAIWCGVDVPVAARPGTYKGTARISAGGGAEQTVELTFNVSNEIAAAGRANEPEKMTRLKWLNSTLAQANTVIPPYTPIEVKGNVISILGRSMSLNNDGLPGSIATQFSEMTSMSGYNQVLVRPMSLSVTGADGAAFVPMPKGVVFTQKSPGTVKWRASTKYANVQADIEGAMEFDGFVEYTVKVTALEDVSLKDIQPRYPVFEKRRQVYDGPWRKGQVLN